MPELQVKHNNVRLALLLGAAWVGGIAALVLAIFYAFRYFTYPRY